MNEMTAMFVGFVAPAVVVGIVVSGPEVAGARLELVL
ncbi:hypothetical protein BJY16_003863 [Actinoplanes octamycinicus]|uniref:Uncharacterized protein n=1 Tax=Actinoplanes octamycinicus TaxID=135948 RepID=A0A7W7M810_9ACTN|nr:hypothetical protein [Actinoplanes octamycinicus]